MSRYAALWSSGKDSALAVQRFRESGRNLTRLLTFHDAASGRVRFHATRSAIVAAQADCLGLPITQIPTWPETFDETFCAVLDALRSEGFNGVVSGDIHLADVRSWHEERIRGAGLEHVEPLWGEEPCALLEEFVAMGGRAVVTCVDMAKLDESWLGRVIDPPFAADMSAEEMRALGIDPCGENGEYHSFAIDGPLFRRPFVWLAGERRAGGGFAQMDIRDAVGEAAAEAIANHSDLAAAVRIARPKAWGILAGKGVLALRVLLGRPPTESERRALWHTLWGLAHK